MTLPRRTLLTRFALGLAALPLLSGRLNAASHGGQTVTIQGMAFDPPEMTIAAGTGIAFVNEDGAPHTATADDGSFDTGRLNKGESSEILFPTAGTFAYHCDIHRSMKATIIVT